MVLRQSVLFAVVLFWNLTESAFDNDNKTIAHDNSSSSRLNENPLDGHSLLELQESATVNDTNRVDQLNEARGPTTYTPLLQQIHPVAKFKALDLDKYTESQLDFKTATLLRSWMKYAETYVKHGRKKRWYTTEKAFLVLVKTYPVDLVLYVFRSGDRQKEVRMLQGGLAKPFSALRRSMNQEWLKSKTGPDTVFRLLDVGKESIEKDQDSFHWIWYCDEFRQKYGDDAFPAVKIVELLQKKDTLGHPLLYDAYFRLVVYKANILRFLAHEMEIELFTQMIKAKITPFSAYTSLKTFMNIDLLRLTKTDRRLHALEAYTLAYNKQPR